MSFDAWIHVLEIAMVVGTGAVIVFLKRNERRGNP